MYIICIVRVSSSIVDNIVCMVVCVYFIIIAKYVLKRLSSVYISTLCIEYIHIHKVGKYIYI